MGDCEKKERIIPHPLEGKYIVFKYTECISAEDCEKSALALFKLNKGKLENIWTPSATNPWNYPGLNEKLIEMMKRKGLQEVYSVYWDGDFFGIPKEEVELTEPRKCFDHDTGEKTEKLEYDWYQYESVCFDTEEGDLLKRGGITLHIYDENLRVFHS
ncbi:MAG: hypothetical protein Q8Q15_03625 [bacterium]|nr:hypothetical protein [bacterium]